MTDDHETDEATLNKRFYYISNLYIFTLNVPVSSQMKCMPLVTTVTEIGLYFKGYKYQVSIMTFRCEYSNMFTASASVALLGLTVFYSVAIFALYLSDSLQLERRPAAVPQH